MGGSLRFDEMATQARNPAGIVGMRCFEWRMPDLVTLLNNCGSYEIAECVVKCIRNSKLPLAAMLAYDVKPFDPSNPDPVADFNYAVGPLANSRKPDGN